MANTPLKITIPQTQAELEKAWTQAYSAERNASALEWLRDKPINIRVMHLAMRLFFRGIYFPQMTKRAWLKLVMANRRPVYQLVREGIGKWRAANKKKSSTLAVPAQEKRSDVSVAARIGG
jgi:hypothetical protein